MRGFWCWAAIAVLLVVPAGARAVDMKTALDKLGFPADTAAQVEAGKFVDVPLTTATERDLNVGIAFLVKEDPTKLARMLEEKRVQTIDPGRSPAESSRAMERPSRWRR